MDLSAKERLLLDRISRQKNLYLTFSIASVVIAVSLIMYFGFVIKTMNSLRVVLIILVLLAGRSHLRQYRSAVLLHKLKTWLDQRGDENETCVK